MPLDDAYAQKKAALDREIMQEMQAENRRRWIEICRAMSEIGKHFSQRRLETYEPTTHLQREALATCRAIVEGDIPAGAYFFGSEPGVGKTHLAAGIVNAATERGIPAVFTTSAGLVQRIRETYNRFGKVREGERDITDRLSRVEILVLDDLGTEPFTPDTARLFYLLLNARIENDLPLIVTSNLSPADLGIAWMRSGVDEHLGAKLIDRIKGMCGVVVKVDGLSRRGAQ